MTGREEVFILAAEIIKVSDSIAWACCVSGLDIEVIYIGVLYNIVLPKNGKDKVKVLLIDELSVTTDQQIQFLF